MHQVILNLGTEGATLGGWVSGQLDNGHGGHVWIMAMMLLRFLMLMMLEGGPQYVDGTGKDRKLC